MAYGSKTPTVGLFAAMFGASVADTRERSTSTIGRSREPSTAKVTPSTSRLSVPGNMTAKGFASRPFRRRSSATASRLVASQAR